MITRINFSVAQGADLSAEVSVTASSGTIDWSDAGAVQVEVYRVGAFEDEAPLFTLLESASEIERTTPGPAATVAFRFLVSEERTAEMIKGDYEWRCVDTSGELTTESAGGVLTIE